MLVRLTISEEFDISDDTFFTDDDPLFEDNPESYTIENRVDMMVNRFCESIDELVKYNRVIDAVQVEYLEN